jgi:fatty acyl-CoA reductase
VISSYMEPIKYWKDSLGAPCCLICFALLGYGRLFACDYHRKLEVVPVDMTVAALIASASDITSKNTKVPVYNYISSNDNPINVYDFFSYCSLHLTRYPLSNAVWTPRFKIVESLDEFKLWTFWYHVLPALLMDLISLLCFKKPQFFSKMRKVNSIFQKTAYFSTRSWPYSNKNVKDLWNKMDKRDRQLFCFDLSKVNWLEHIRNLQKGLRIYRFKDPLSTLPQAKTRMQR